MVDGGDNIVEVSWESVSSILQVVSAKGWLWDPEPLYSNRRAKILDSGNPWSYVFGLCVMTEWPARTTSNRAWFLQWKILV